MQRKAGIGANNLDQPCHCLLLSSSLNGRVQATAINAVTGITTTDFPAVVPELQSEVAAHSLPLSIRREYYRSSAEHNSSPAGRATDQAAKASVREFAERWRELAWPIEGLDRPR